MRTNFSSETEFPGTEVSRDQLQIICHRYYFASKFVSEKEILEVGFLHAMAKMVGKVLDLMPKGSELKEFINKCIIHKIVLKEEIENGDIRAVENTQLVPILSALPDHQHRILYAIAHETVNEQ